MTYLFEKTIDGISDFLQLVEISSISFTGSNIFAFDPDSQSVVRRRGKRIVIEDESTTGWTKDHRSNKKIFLTSIKTSGNVRIFG